MEFMRLDGILLGDNEAQKFNAILTYYNTKITPDDPYTRQEMAVKLLGQGILQEWHNKIWKEGQEK